MKRVFGRFELSPGCDGQGEAPASVLAVDLGVFQRIAGAYFISLALFELVSFNSENIAEGGYYSTDVMSLTCASLNIVYFRDLGSF